MCSKKNAILALKIEGLGVHDKNHISTHIADFYRNHFKNPFVKRPCLLGSELSKLDVERRNWLERPFS